jgi:membrane protease YdiL (CAAX protease family)
VSQVSAIRGPRWTAGQLLLVATLALAVPAAGLLRSLHEHTPRLWPGPLGSVLGLGALALLAVHLAWRRHGADHFPAPGERRGLTTAMLLPIVVVLLAEKWLSSELLGRAYGWIPLAVEDPAAADALYRLWTGMALLGFGLAAFWIMRQIGHRLRGMLTAERVRPALVLLAAAALVPGLLALTLHFLVPGSRLTSSVPVLSTLVLACGAQVVRAGAEELYFRGLLQTGTARLLAQTPLGDGRVPRLAAIGLVSLAFTLEHLGPQSFTRSGLRELIFVFGISCALGALLAASRNLYLVAGAHVLINLIVARLLPLPVDAEGEPLLPANVLAVLVLIVAFVGVAILHRRADAGAEPEPD